MTSYGFEVAGKNAIIKTLEKKYGKQIKIQELHTVWFSYVLGNMKMIITDAGPSNRIYEVTYNRQANKMYVDVYEKQLNATYTENEFKSVVEE